MNHRTRIIFYQAWQYFYQYRQYCRGGEVCLFVKESFCCKTRQDLSINCDAIESLCLEITNEKSKNIILNLTYRQPNGDVKEFEKHLNEILSTNDILKKEVIMAGDFSMSLLDFEQNKKVQNFLNIMFGHSMMPVINKPTRVTKNTETAIDHIFINSVITTKFKTGIIKSGISDHFLIFFVADYNIHIKETKEYFIFRRDLSDNSVEKFKYKLRTVSWDSITNSSDTKKAYDNFIEIFSSLYDECFPKKKIKKPQKYNNPWITKGIKKLSKRKQKLDEKFLRNKNEKNEKLYKSYKSLFESVKRKSKRIYYSSKILEFKNNAKKTWGVMKELIGEARNTESSLPTKLVIEKKEVTEIKDIAEEQKNLITFYECWAKFSQKVPNSSNSFTSFLNQTHSITEKNLLSINELKETFFSLKTNKSPGCDDINFNVVKKCFGEINEPLKHLFNLSLENGIFPEKNENC